MVPVSAVDGFQVDTVADVLVGHLSPGPALYPSGELTDSPEEVMVAELVETSKLWGRIASRIQPEWVEPLAQHLVKRSYSEPHWEKKRGSVSAFEKQTLYGITLVPKRKVNYSDIDPALCRELFIRSALVEGDFETRHKFFKAVSSDLIGTMVMLAYPPPEGAAFGLTR